MLGRVEWLNAHGLRADDEDVDIDPGDWRAPQGPRDISAGRYLIDDQDDDLHDDDDEDDLSTPEDESGDDHDDSKRRGDSGGGWPRPPNRTTAAPGRADRTIRQPCTEPR